MSSKGKKHNCIKCGANFYDLGKSPATCPKCGAVQNDPALLSKKKKPASEAKRKVTEEALEENLDLIDEAIEDVDIDDVMEDVSIEEKEKTDDL